MEMDPIPQDIMAQRCAERLRGEDGTEGAPKLCRCHHRPSRTRGHRRASWQDSDSAIDTFHHNSVQWISSHVFRSWFNPFRWRGRPLSVLLFLFTLISFQSSNEVSGYIANVRDGVCMGTDWRMAEPSSEGLEDKHYHDLKQRYTNCTYVEGNLEITYLKNHLYDLSFLESITEVTGYVLVMFVYIDVIPLKNLQVIRGKELYPYDNKEYALFVAINKHNAADMGISELRIPLLHEIVRGEVRFVHNDNLCYVETINWGDLRHGLEATIETSGGHVNCSHEDYQCHESCPEDRCWGPGPDMCQRMTMIGCSATCDYRCRGPTPADCCHKSCAAGCHNSSQTGCFACRRFTNGDECVDQCPARTTYDAALYKTVPNPNFKFSYGSRCLDECPENVVENDDNCVKQCPPGKIEQDRMCVECDGPCLQERTCTIESLPEGTQDQILYHEHFLNGSLSNCTKIKGSIIIAQSSFNGDSFHGLSALTMEHLQQLSTVREITGYVSVQAKGHDLDGLSFFRNLEVIKGHELYSGSTAALFIRGTDLESLNLQRLKRVNVGDIRFDDNDMLCYVNERLLERLVTPSYGVLIIDSKDPESCAAEGKVCHEVCKAEDGCWGPDTNQCSQCAYAHYEGTCLPNCEDSVDPLYYVGERGIPGETPDTCMKCDPECLLGCDRAGADNCTEVEGLRKCRNVQDGPFCRAECPQSKYEDGDGKCQDCHANCREDGCTGPENTVGEGGCRRCEKALFQSDGETVIRCAAESEECPDDYFEDRFPYTESEGLWAGTRKCTMCHPECDGCTSSGNSKCEACRNYKRGDYCVPRCDRLQYADANQTCTPCHQECNMGCHGGSNYECVQCSVFSYVDDTNGNLTTCVSQCPASHPYLYGSKSCVKECPEMYHVASNGKCARCNNQCVGGCHDDTSSGCFECKHVNQTGFCQTKCTVGHVLDSRNVCMPEGGTTGNITHPENDTEYLGIILAAVGFFMVLFVILIVFIVCRWRKGEMVYIDYTSNIPLSNLDEQRDPTSPSGVSPNQAILTIIKETQLKRGSILGSGAFGTVYKGLWIPEGEQKIRIPVAIKILRDVSSQASEEFLEEAKVMASVDHPDLLRLLCVCMAGEITLITQLMPLGALLDYIRQHKEKIGSHHLLRWSHQIAEGMVYLEENHLIHRDLAARNVLVQTPAQVKITDFGLAKFLNVDENVYKAQGGKMPIKWLALESIQFRRFSHKSDVWSFGVTLWEIMTFGGKPYDGVKARDVPELLVKGERLQQPPICTIDVYMLMVKCWLEDENSRPSFRQLADELENMLNDPQRYLVVQHDTESDALPSPNPSDFYKSLLSEGMGGVDPSLLMDAEEYLQPMGQMKENYTYEPSQGFAFPPNNNHPPPTGAVGSSDPAAQPLISPAPNESSPENSRKDSTLTRYSQDPIIAKQYERQRSNQSHQDPPEPDYQNDPTNPLGPRQDAYLPLADDGPKGIAVDNLEYHAMLGSPPIEEEVWSPRQPNGNGHNGTAFPYKNGYNDSLSNSTPTLHNPKSPNNGFHRLYSTPTSNEHEYINSDVRVGGPGESTV